MQTSEGVGGKAEACRHSGLKWFKICDILNEGPLFFLNNTDLFSIAFSCIQDILKSRAREQRYHYHRERSCIQDTLSSRARLA